MSPHFRSSLQIPLAEGLQSRQLWRHVADIHAAGPFGALFAMQQVQRAVPVHAIGLQGAAVLQQAAREDEALPVPLDAAPHSAFSERSGAKAQRLGRQDGTELLHARLQVHVQVHLAASLKGLKGGRTRLPLGNFTVMNATGLMSHRNGLLGAPKRGPHILFDLNEPCFEPETAQDRLPQASRAPFLSLSSSTPSCTAWWTGRRSPCSACPP